MPVVVELFSGTARITRALEKCGRMCLAWDVAYGSKYDLCDPAARRLLVGWLAAGLISAIWIAVPCQSFTTARDVPPGPPPLRSDARPLGLTDLSVNDQLLVRRGNMFMRFVALLFQRCLFLDIPVVVENPARSRIWLCPPVAALLALRCTKFVVTDFCGWQALPYRKSTAFMSYGVDLEHWSHVQCCGSFQKCSFTGRPHRPLRGRTPQGRWWTKVAEPYPFRLAYSAARAIDSAIAMRRFRSLRALGVAGHWSLQDTSF